MWWATALALSVAAVFYLVVTAMQVGSAYYLTVAEAAERVRDLGRAMRIQGVVKAEGLSWDLERTRLEFVLADEGRPDRTLRVGYTGARPDGLEPGQTVIVEGRLAEPGRIEASAILVRCPSRYEVEVSKLPRWGR